VDRSSSPGWDLSDGSEDDLETTNPDAPLATPYVKRKTEHTLTPSLVPAKRKTMTEQLQEITEMERITRIKLVETNAKEKTARQALKCKSALKIEEMRIQFQREEAEKNRAHQLEMLKARIELAKISGGGTGAMTVDKLEPSLFDGMGPILPMPGDYQVNNLSLSGSSWSSSFGSSAGTSFDG
jgi:hypothetical protein